MAIHHILMYLADTYELSGSLSDLLSQVPGKRAASSHGMEDLPDCIEENTFYRR
jgi:hypothetical protein